MYQFQFDITAYSDEVMNDKLSSIELATTDLISDAIIISENRYYNPEDGYVLQASIQVIAHTADESDIFDEIDEICMSVKNCTIHTVDYEVTETQYEI